MLTCGDSYVGSYPAEAESVMRARGDVTRFAVEAGASRECLETIRLAVSEAVTNAVTHAYSRPGDGTITVSASLVEDELSLLIADSGSGLTARCESGGLGVGLKVIAQLADDLQIHSRGGGGTELQMRFRRS